MKEFVAIMPCHIINEEILKLTQNAIESLGGVDLVIIDNASPMGGGYLRSIAKVYIRNDTNQSYSISNNQGLKVVHDFGNDNFKDYKYYVLISNDVRVSPNWKEVTRSVFAPGVKIYSLHFRMTNYDVPFKYGTKFVTKGMERWCTAAFFIVSWPKLLLFDENYFNSYEDWDYFHRIRRQGLYTAYTNKACFQHHHSFTKRFLPELEKSPANREYFKKKYSEYTKNKGEYPEEMFQRLYPEQWEKEYYAGFDI